MSSTILYKFRSGTAFEALPLPGSAARLFDVKKGIVRAKKLDGNSMEFDLAVRNADTNEEYVNEAMVLPRGTRLIVQRLPAARGQGFLARMARNEQLQGGHPNAMYGQLQQHQQQQASGFYTIDSSRNDEEDEFVSTNAGGGPDQELAALQAVTSLRPDGPAMTGGGGGFSGGPGRGAGRGGFRSHAPSFRHSADPEIREQEKKLMPKKRATGIPRTFLNLNAPPQTDGTQDGEGNDSSVPLLQPNAIGFEELKSRGGGQSEIAAGTKKDLDYALKLTATTIPDYLQCAICGNVVKNAMMLPWDPEGRTTCESCIRDALTQNGYRCPLTGQDGVSPDDLIPNIALRKAAETFIKGVMDKYDEVEKQQVQEAETTAADGAEGNAFDGDGAEKGVIVSRKVTLTNKAKVENDPFGGDDIFGGDVFAVPAPKLTDAGGKADAEDVTVKKEPGDSNNAAVASSTGQAKDGGSSAAPDRPGSSAVKTEVTGGSIKAEETSNGGDRPNDARSSSAGSQAGNRPGSTEGGHGRGRYSDRNNDNESESSGPSAAFGRESSRRDAPGRRDRRRGPPAGYAMGPAGGAASARRDQGRPPRRDGIDSRHGNSNSNARDSGRSRKRSASIDSEGSSSFNQGQHQRGRGDDGRSSKRGRNEDMNGGPLPPPHRWGGGRGNRGRGPEPGYPFPPPGGGRFGGPPPPFRGRDPMPPDRYPARGGDPGFRGGRGGDRRNDGGGGRFRGGRGGGHGYGRGRF